jgi:toxin CcdB
LAQFALYCLKGGLLVVDLQTDLLGIKASRIVAPLREAGRYASFPGLTPLVEMEGQVWSVRVQELAANLSDQNSGPACWL